MIGARRQGRARDGVRYDSRLIGRFKGHHRILLKLLDRTRAAAREGDYELVSDTLSQFRSVLREHLLEENLRLYDYLRRNLESDADNYRLIDEMKAEMVDLGQRVEGFVDAYLDSGVDADNVEAFRRGLRETGELLSERVRREEESLYELYLPPDQYA